MRVGAIGLVEEDFDLTGGMQSRTVPDQQHLPDGLSTQELRKLNHVVRSLLLESTSKGLSGADIWGAVEGKVVVGSRNPNGPLLPNELPHVPKRREPLQLRLISAVEAVVYRIDRTANRKLVSAYDSAYDKETGLEDLEARVPDDLFTQLGRPVVQHWTKAGGR